MVKSVFICPRQNSGKHYIWLTQNKRWPINGGQQKGNYGLSSAGWGRSEEKSMNPFLAAGESQSIYALLLPACLLPDIKICPHGVRWGRRVFLQLNTLVGGKTSTLPHNHPLADLPYPLPPTQYYTQLHSPTQHFTPLHSTSLPSSLPHCTRVPFTPHSVYYTPPHWYNN